MRYLNSLNGKNPIRYSGFGVDTESFPVTFWHFWLIVKKTLWVITHTRLKKNLTKQYLLLLYVMYLGLFFNCFILFNCLNASYEPLIDFRIVSVTLWKIWLYSVDPLKMNDNTRTITDPLILVPLEKSQIRKRIRKPSKFSFQIICTHTRTNEKLPRPVLCLLT